MTDPKHHIVDEKIRPDVDPQDWVHPGDGDDRYGPDQLTAAHNAKRAGYHTRTVLDRLMDRGLHPLAAILNDTKFDAPEVMIVLPADEYVGEAFTGMYSVVGELERQWTEPNYAISFAFTYQGDNLNYDLLSADGFNRFHRYLLGDEQGTRRTQRNTL